MAARDETPPARLIEALYAGVADVAAWNRFLLAFADHMGASRAVLLLTRAGEDRPREILSPGRDRHRAALYVDRHFATDPLGSNSTSARTLVRLTPSMEVSSNAP